MKWSVPAWSLGFALLIIVPVGLRVLSWPDEQRPVASSEDVRAGAVLFSHEWQPNDPLCAGGDGLGPVYNDTSCAACHRQGGLGGGGSLEHNVTLFTTAMGGRDGSRREGVIHAHAVAKPFQETLAMLHGDLPPISQPSLRQVLGDVPERDGVQIRRRATRRSDKLAVINRCLDNTAQLRIPPGIRLAQRNTPALFGTGQIDSIPDRVILANARWQRLQFGFAPDDTEDFPVGRPGRLADGRVGKFGWKAQSASLSDFVQAACANELGLSNPGHFQAQPLGKPDYQAAGLDLTQKQCDQLTAFIAALPAPEERLPANAGQRTSAGHGKELFRTVGCASCHTQNLGSVTGIYSDLLLHRMGQDLEASGDSYGGGVPPPESSPGETPLPDEWRTPPLWGVADSGPYLHDGRAATLEDAILLHGGQGNFAAERFEKLNRREQDQLIAFLQTLRAPSGNR